jgi:hypothetical protein
VGDILNMYKHCGRRVPKFENASHAIACGIEVLGGYPFTLSQIVHITKTHVTLRSNQHPSDLLECNIEIDKYGEHCIINQRSIFSDCQRFNVTKWILRPYKDSIMIRIKDRIKEDTNGNH